ncbi:MAG: two-component system sensor histidine kinase DesK [Arenicella sp.]|jgi:two-component system sensor histidine kinase DesK
MTFSRLKNDSYWKQPIGERPGFYLVYLLFYFFPWLFVTPSNNDIIAAVVAISLFLPIYFHGHKQVGLKAVPHIAAMSAIGFAVSPFFGAHGVFHIYAMVQAGFIRPPRLAWITALITTVIFSIFSWFTQQSWWDYSFPVFMGIITAIATISTAARIQKNVQLERTRALDQQLAAVAERERIAQDLHDLLGQTLTMVALKSEVAVKLFEKKPQQAKQELEEIRDAARSALKDVREAVAGMNKTSLNAELKRARQILSSAGVELTVTGEIPKLKAEVDQVLGLTVREAMTNIVRHSKAKSASFLIEHAGENLRLTVEDHGLAEPIKEGSGLAGLRKRIENLGGQTNLELTPGLKISMQVPDWEPNQND